MTLGEKIRTLRKEKKLTQKELVGEEFTRNMLSRIESDDALPSLSNLLYLAEKLDIPVGYLLDEEADLHAYRRMALIPRMKQLFAEQRYSEVIELGDSSFTAADSELCILLSESALALTIACIHKGKMQSAATYLEKLQRYSAVLTYGNGHILCAIALFSAILRNVQVPKYNLQASSFPAILNQAVYTDLFCYLSEQDAGHTYHDPMLSALSEGRRLMAAGRYSDAIRHFEQLEEAKSNRDTSLFLLFRLYGELEACHKELRNFEYAYRYAAKRMSLISAFRS